MCDVYLNDNQNNKNIHHIYNKSIIICLTFRDQNRRKYDGFQPTTVVVLTLML